MKTKYLITGGCGFIGSHLATALMARGSLVRILDNLTTGKKEKAPIGSELIVGDIRDKNILKRAFEGIDLCFHLAAVPSAEQSVKAYGETHEVNGGGTVNVIEALLAEKRKIPLIYASSAAVYGKAERLPLREETPLAPLSPYGVDKWSGEEQLKVMGRLYGLPSMTFRLFNVYGPGQDPHSPYSGVISLFTHHVREGKPLTIYGEGTQRRDFIHVSDVVAYLLEGAARLNEGCFLFNLCTGKTVSILELGELLEQVMGKRVEKFYLPKRQGDISVSQGDPRRAVAFFKREPQVSLKEGLEGLCASYC